jgi:hypothetical protein
MNCLFNLFLLSSFFSLPSSSLFLLLFLLPSSRAVGSKVRLLPASLSCQLGARKELKASRESLFSVV